MNKWTNKSCNFTNIFLPLQRNKKHQNINLLKNYKVMLGIEEKDPVITGKYADDLYEEYKSVYGEPEYHKNDKQV